MLELVGGVRWFGRNSILAVYGSIIALVTIAAVKIAFFYLFFQSYVLIGQEFVA